MLKSKRELLYTVNSYKYFIGIPSRNRISTLLKCIESLAWIDRSDVQIVFSLNGYNDQDIKIIGAAITENIKSISTEVLIPQKLLSMPDNFEFCLKACRARYVSFIGDDDTIVCNAFELADQHFDEDPGIILSWYRWPYYWPKEKEHDGLLFLHSCTRAQRIYSRDLLKDMFYAWPDYTFLPSVYNSFVPVSVIKNIKNFNRAIDCHNPLFANDSYRLWPATRVVSVDVYTAFAIPAFVDYYDFLLYPLTVSGISNKSNGLSNKRDPNGESTRFASELGVSAIDQLVDRRIGGPSSSSTLSMSTDLLRVAERYYSNALGTLSARRILGLSLIRMCAQELSQDPELLKEITKISIDNAFIVQNLAAYSSKFILPLEKQATYARNSCVMAIQETILASARRVVIDASAYGILNLKDVALNYHRLAASCAL